MPTVTAIYEISDGLTGGLNVEDQSGGKYTHVYHVEFDETNGSHWAALAAENLADTIPDDEVSAIPPYGYQHWEDETSLVVEKTADPLPDSWGRTWKVTVRYAYPKVDVNAGGSPPDPTDPGEGNEPPFPLPNLKRSWGYWTRQRGFRRDASNAAIVNSAGDPFSPPLTDDEPFVQVTFVRSQTNYDAKWGKYFLGTLNNAEFKIWSSPKEFLAAKWSLKVIGITGDETPATGKTPAWWTVTIVIQHNPYTWLQEPLDQGGRYLQAGVPVPYTNAGGIPTVGMLDGAGGKRVYPAAPVFLDGDPPPKKGPYRLQPQTDFRWLALTV